MVEGVKVTQETAVLAKAVERLTLGIYRGKRGCGGERGKIFKGFIIYLSPRRPGGDKRVEAEKRGFQLLALRGRPLPVAAIFSKLSFIGERGGAGEKGERFLKSFPFLPRKIQPRNLEASKIPAPTGGCAHIVFAVGFRLNEVQRKTAVMDESG